MKTFQLSMIVLLASSTCATSAMSNKNFTGPSPSSIVAPPAPVEGVFSRDQINELLTAKGCVGIRFYTVLRTSEPSSTSVVAIPVDKDGKELRRWFLSTPYVMYTGLSGNSVGTSKSGEGKASDACIDYTNAGGSCFAATISRSDVDDVLKTNCGAVRLTVQENKFQMTAVNVADGKIQVMGQGATYQRMSSEPCPVTCGADPSVYLKMK